MSVRDWLRALPTVQGRLLSGAAFFVAIVVGLWDGHNNPFDPAKGFAVLVTGLAWLFAELAGLPKMSDHDRTLFNSIFENIRDREKSLLRDHDFGAGFAHGDSEGIRTLSSWAGVNYQFDDKAMQARWVPVKADIEGFDQLLGHHTAPKGGNAGWMSAIPDNTDDFNMPDWVSANVDQLNAASTKLIVDLESFQSYGRKRISL